MCRINDGFEDREGHQAPFTLREDENVEPAFARLRRGRRPTSNVQRPTETEDKETDRLLNFLNCRDDGVEVRPVTGFEFGMEQFSIGADFESAAARRNESERRDALAEFKNLGRQTDGLRRVVSNHAIFDRDFSLHPARSFPMKMVRKSRERVKVRAALAF